MSKYTPSVDQNTKLDVAFMYHKPKEDQPLRYEKLRAMARSLAEMFNENCPSSRELSLAMTKLEEAVMWANAAIARNE